MSSSSGPREQARDGQLMDSLRRLQFVSVWGLILLAGFAFWAAVVIALWSLI